MKKQLRKSCFTLVEVLIAMGICVVGVVSVMGLFPVGANTARDANMAFYADQAADQMLHFIKFAILNDTNANKKVFCTLADCGDVNNPSTSQSKPDDSAEPSDWDSVDSVADNALISTLESNFVKMLASSGTKILMHNKQLYRLSFLTKDGSDDIEDFAGVVRLWATPMYADEENSSTPLPRAATFHIEMSWPADLPYNRRQKAEYTLDIFVPEG